MTPPDWIYPDLFDEDQLPLYQGFVYLIENLDTGRAYVGKKFTKAKRKGKTVESDWRRYWGSSTDLCLDLKRLGHHRFRRTILYFCLTKAATNFHEVEEQFKRDVLSAKLPDGSPKFYNKNIMGRWFTAPETTTPEANARRSASMTGLKRKPFTEEHRAKISASLVGTKRAAGHVPSAEKRAKISAALTGRQQSPKDVEKRKRTCAALKQAGLPSGGRPSAFTEDEVRFIRSSLETGAELARRFGVSQTTITRVRKLKAYAWVTP